jgi:hypothetical protein
LSEVRNAAHGGLVAAQALADLAVGGGEQRIARSFDEAFMEGRGELVVGAGIASRDARPHVAHELAQPRQGGAFAAPGERCGGEGFNRHAHAEEFLQLGLRKRAHGRAAMEREIHEAFGGEDAEGLPQGHAADATGQRELGFDETRAGGKPALHDLLAQMGGQTLRQAVRPGKGDALQSVQDWTASQGRLLYN